MNKTFARGAARGAGTMAVALALTLPAPHAHAVSKQDALRVMNEIKLLGEQCSYETIEAWRVYTLDRMREMRDWLRSDTGAAFLGEPQLSAQLNYLDQTIEFMNRPIREIGLNSTTSDKLANAHLNASNWRKNDKLFADKVNYKWEIGQWIGRYAFACYNRELKRRGFTDTAKAKCEFTEDDKPMTVGLFPNFRHPYNDTIARCGFNATKRNMSLAADMPSPPAYSMTPGGESIGATAAVGGMADAPSGKQLDKLKSAGLGLLGKLKAAAGAGVETSPQASIGTGPASGMSGGDVAPGMAVTSSAPAPSLASIERDGPIPGAPSRIKSQEVGGISLSMGVAEVKKILKTRAPAMESLPIEVKSYGTQWTGQYALLPAEVIKRDNRFNKKSDEVVIVDFASPPAEQQALAIVRYKRYGKDKTPSLAATEASLIEKYGPWDSVQTVRGANHYLWGRHAATGASCLTVKHIDPDYRLKDLTEAEGSQAVICQGYGTWWQCLKPVRHQFDFQPSMQGCGVQLSAYVNFTNKGGKEQSPVNELQTFIVDIDKLWHNEQAYSGLAKRHEKGKNQDAIRAGGKPAL